MIYKLFVSLVVISLVQAADQGNKIEKDVKGVVTKYVDVEGLEVDLAMKLLKGDYYCKNYKGQKAKQGNVGENITHSDCNAICYNKQITAYTWYTRDLYKRFGKCRCCEKNYIKSKSTIGGSIYTAIEAEPYKELPLGGPEKCIGLNCRDYRGKQTKTKNGFTCMNWSVTNPHEHPYNAKAYPTSGLDENYCRNPMGSEWPNLWCYTTDPQKRWDNCLPVGQTDAFLDDKQKAARESIAFLNTSLAQANADEKAKLEADIAKLQKAIENRDIASKAAASSSKDSGPDKKKEEDEEVIVQKKCKPEDFAKIEEIEDASKCVIHLDPSPSHCPMQSGCEITWDKSKEESKTLGASITKEVIIGEAEISAEMSDTKTEESSTKGKQAYGTTYCAFMEVTKDTKGGDFSCKGPKKFVTCGIDCSKFPTCKKMNATECGSIYLSIAAAMYVLYIEVII